MTIRRAAPSRFARVAVGLAGAVLVALLVGAGPAGADDFYPGDALTGTMWLSMETHDRTTIDLNGVTEIKQGKYLYLEVVELTQGIYTIKIQWWNETVGIHVVEYAVMLREGDNIYRYEEAGHPPDSAFPGIAGGGLLRLLDETHAEISQIGRLIDESASAFVTSLTKVDAPPDIPVAQTYP
jgi:hypothetical protein